MSDGDILACRHCGARVEGGTAACDEMMRAIGARSTDARKLVVRRTLVDAYALQHPESRCRTPRELAAHLLNLCCAIEHNGSLELYSGMKVWLRRAGELPELAPPEERGAMTIADVAAARDIDAYIDTVRRWAHCVWEAWYPHHDVVRGWMDEIAARR